MGSVLRVIGTLGLIATCSACEGASTTAPLAGPARIANAYGNDCMQNRLPFDSAPSDQPQSEDCLVLNVWAPAAKRETARQISDYWIAFARTGNPNGGDHPVWPAYSAQTDESFELTNQGPVARKHLDQKRLDYLQSRWEARGP
jgi:carboxylesterase type B